MNRPVFQVAISVAMVPSNFHVNRSHFFAVEFQVLPLAILVPFFFATWKMYGKVFQFRNSKVLFLCETTMIGVFDERLCRKNT